MSARARARHSEVITCLFIVVGRVYVGGDEVAVSARARQRLGVATCRVDLSATCRVDYDPSVVVVMAVFREDRDLAETKKALEVGPAVRDSFKLAVTRKLTLRKPRRPDWK